MEIKLITMLLLMTFSVSCKNQKFICAEIKKSEIPPTVMHNINFQFNRCRVRCFDLNKWEALPIKDCPELNPLAEQGFSVSQEVNENGVTEESINLEISACDGIIGFSADDASKKVRPSVKALANIKKDSCGE